MEKETLLTQQDFNELQEQLDYLKSEGRKEAAEKLKVARSFGDLSENSEYDEAKSDQAKLEARIVELEALLSNVKIIEDSLGNETVQMYSVVTIKETTRGAQEKTFQITAYAQADPLKGKISDESPVGKALLGHKTGDKVKVEAPRGVMTYKIVKIESGKNV